MNNIWLVASAGIKNALRMKTTMVISLLVTLICVVGVALLMCLLLIAPEMKSASPDRAALAGYLNLVLYSSSLISVGAMLNGLVFQTMVKEKTRGNLAALLATPLKVSEIWLGKSLVLIVPGMALGVLLAALNLVIINLIYFMPSIGFIFNIQMLVNVLLAVPVMYLALGVLVHLIGMTTKPATGNIVAQVFLPVIANLMIQLTAHDVMSADSWQFLAMNFGIAAVLAGIVLAVSSRLDPERVLLSAG